MRGVTADRILIGVEADERGQAPTSATEIERQIAGFPAWFEIDFDALGANLAAIQRHTGVEVMPVGRNWPGFSPWIRHSRPGA